MRSMGIWVVEAEWERERVSEWMVAMVVVEERVVVRVVVPVAVSVVVRERIRVSGSGSIRDGGREGERVVVVVAVKYVVVVTACVR